MANSVRSRRVSIAAGALSLALVAPFVSPVVDVPAAHAVEASAFDTRYSTGNFWDAQEAVVQGLTLEPGDTVAATTNTIFNWRFRTSGCSLILIRPESDTAFRSGNRDIPIRVTKADGTSYTTTLLVNVVDARATGNTFTEPADQCPTPEPTTTTEATPTEPAPTPEDTPAEGPTTTPATTTTTAVAEPTSTSTSPQTTASTFNGRYTTANFWNVKEAAVEGLTLQPGDVVQPTTNTAFNWHFRNDNGTLVAIRPDSAAAFRTGDVDVPVRVTANGQTFRTTLRLHVIDKRTVGEWESQLDNRYVVDFEKSTSAQPVAEITLPEGVKVSKRGIAPAGWTVSNDGATVRVTPPTTFKEGDFDLPISVNDGTDTFDATLKIAAKNPSQTPAETAGTVAGILGPILGGLIGAGTGGGLLGNLGNIIGGGSDGGEGSGGGAGRLINVVITGNANPSNIGNGNGSPNVIITNNANPNVIITDNVNPRDNLSNNGNPSVVVTGNANPVVTGNANPNVVITNNANPTVDIKDNLSNNGNPSVVVTGNANPVITNNANPSVVITGNVNDNLRENGSNNSVVVTNNANPVVTNNASNNSAVVTGNANPVITNNANPVVTNNANNNGSNNSAVVTGNANPVITGNANDNLREAGSNNSVVVTNNANPVVTGNANDNLNNNGSGNSAVVTGNANPVVTNNANDNGSNNSVIATNNANPIITGNLNPRDNLNNNGSNNSAVVTDNANPNVEVKDNANPTVVITGNANPDIRDNGNNNGSNNSVVATGNANPEVIVTDNANFGLFGSSRKRGQNGAEQDGEGNGDKGSSGSSLFDTNVNVEGGSSDPRCIASLVGLGLPLIALVPLALANQLNIDIPNTAELNAQAANVVNHAARQFGLAPEQLTAGAGALAGLVAALIVVSAANTCVPNVKSVDVNVGRRPVETVAAPVIETAGA